MSERSLILLKYNIINSNKALLLFLIIFVISACSPFYYEAPSNYAIQDSGITKIPIKVALYLKPEFRNYVVYRQMAANNPNTYFKVGQSLSYGAKKITETLFKEVTVIDVENYDFSHTEFKAIVVPEVKDIGFRDWDAVFFIEWKIVSTGGEVLYVNTFSGKGVIDPKYFQDYRQAFGEGISKAIEDCFQKSLVGIVSSNWWKNL